MKTASELFYADAILADQARLALPAEHEERAVYLAEGKIELAGETFEAARLTLDRFENMRCYRGLALIPIRQSCTLWHAERELAEDLDRIPSRHNVT